MPGFFFAYQLPFAAYISQHDKLLAAIARDEDRMLALGKMVSKLYEDRMIGTLSEDNFQMLMKNTQNEQQELEKRLMDEKNQLAGTTMQGYDSRQWIDLISQYTDIEDIDAETLNRLVRRIVVHEDIDENNIRHLRVEVFFNFQPIPAVQETIPDEQRPYSQKTDYRPVINVDTGERFRSIRAASASVNRTSQNSHIRDCCEGRRKMALGYHWRYADS